MQVTGCNANPINMFTGTREYLVFVVDRAVACGGIASLNFRDALVSSGFVRVVVP